MPKHKKFRVADRVIRRVATVGWTGREQVRLDVGGSPRDPRWSISVFEGHPLSGLKEGDRLPGTFVYEIVRRNDYEDRTGREEARLDCGGTPKAPTVHVYCSKRTADRNGFREGDHISL